jgi:hypothetical protein
MDDFCEAQVYDCGENKIDQVVNLEQLRKEVI